MHEWMESLGKLAVTRLCRSMLVFLAHVKDELLLVGFISLFLSVFQVGYCCHYIHRPQPY
jgi:hypothetical protein